MLREEIRIKDNCLLCIDPHKRPHYSPTERMAILQLRAARGWSQQQTADVFQITAATISSWMRRLNEVGPHALLRLCEPVNRFPDFVRYTVQRLKALCPQMGKVRIAQLLARAGLHLAPTTVGRILKEERQEPHSADLEMPSRRVTAKRPNHVWHVDLTTVPISDGFWTPWLPFALPQAWPFCWWVAVVVDHFPRRVMGFAIFQGRPTSAATRGAQTDRPACRRRIERSTRPMLATERNFHVVPIFSPYGLSRGDPLRGDPSSVEPTRVSSS